MIKEFRIIFFTSLFAASLFGCKKAEAQSDELNAYYIGFDVETIVGYNRNTIIEYGCRSFVKTRDLDKISKHIPRHNNAFIKSHLKLLVTNYRGGDLEVDVNGIAKHGETFLQFLPSELEKVIYVRDKKCAKY